MGILEQLEQNFSESELELLKHSPEFTACLERIVEIESLLPFFKGTEEVCSFME